MHFYNPIIFSSRTWELPLLRSFLKKIQSLSFNLHRGVEGYILWGRTQHTVLNCKLKAECLFSVKLDQLENIMAFGSHSIPALKNLSCLSWQSAVFDILSSCYQWNQLSARHPCGVIFFLKKVSCECICENLSLGGSDFSKILPKVKFSSFSWIGSMCSHSGWVKFHIQIFPTDVWKLIRTSS